MTILAKPLLLALLAAPAAGQPDDGTTIRLEKPTIAVIKDCDKPLGLCFGRRIRKLALGARRGPRVVQKGAFDRFTNLAGMFMGKTDAASIGGFKLRLAIDIR